MKAVVCGSFAYDNILNFEGNFGDHLIESELNNINVSFLCSNMRREFGGCAGNIIYNLVSIGADAISLGTMGSDANQYIEWMKKNKIDIAAIQETKVDYNSKIQNKYYTWYMSGEKQM